MLASHAMRIGVCWHVAVAVHCIKEPSRCQDDRLLLGCLPFYRTLALRCLQIAVNGELAVKVLHILPYQLLDLYWVPQVISQ